jgi:hypothetical protein
MLHENLYENNVSPGSENSLNNVPLQLHEEENSEDVLMSSIRDYCQTKASKNNSTLPRIQLFKKNISDFVIENQYEEKHPSKKLSPLKFKQPVICETVHIKE